MIRGSQRSAALGCAVSLALSFSAARLSAQEGDQVDPPESPPGAPEEAPEEEPEDAGEPAETEARPESSEQPTDPAATEGEEPESAPSPPEEGPPSAGFDIVGEEGQVEEDEGQEEPVEPSEPEEPVEEEQVPDEKALAPRPPIEEDEPPAVSPETPPPQEQAAPAEDPMRLFLAGDLSTFLGQGTFVANSGARNPYVGWLLTARPMFMPNRRTRFFVIQFVSQEFTNTDSDTKNRRVLLSDTLLGGRYTYYTWPRTKTSFDAGMIARAPTSISARHQTLLFAMRPGLGLTQPLGKKVALQFRTEYRKNFHRYTTAVGKVDDGGDAVFLARQGGAEALGDGKVSTGANNTSYEFWNRVLVSYRFLPNWAFNGLVLVINGFTYESFPLDEMSGVGAKEGRGQRDRAISELSISYTWAQDYTLAGGIVGGVAQSTLTPADGRGVRFPLFDFTSPSRNITALFLRFSIAHSVLGAPQETQMNPNMAAGPGPDNAF